MHRISYINGEYTPHEQCNIHIEDRGFQFADGIYEVILYYQNNLIDAAWHLERLYNSLAAVKIKLAMSEAQITQIALNLFTRNKLSTGSVYLQVTRGVSPRSLSIPDEIAPTFIATVSPLQQSTSSSLGISSITALDMRWSYCNIKSIGLLASSFAKQQATELGYDDAILIRDNLVTECTFSNVFIIDKDSTIITRNTDQYILPGITRSRIIALAINNGLKIEERPFSKDELMAAQEVFASSSTLMVRPILSIDGYIVGDGKPGIMTQKIIQLYQDFIKNPA